MTLKQIRTTIIVIALVTLSGFIGYNLGQKQLSVQIENLKPTVTINREVPVGKENVDFALFWETWDRLKASYLNKSALDERKMVYGAISGMVASLGDPYTVFLPPQEQKQSREELSGAFEGVGIQLGYKDSRLAVVAPLSGTPADKAGVKAGDLIYKIKDEVKNIDKETTGMTLPEAVTIIRGPKGSPVTLTLAREGEKEPLEVRLIRGTIFVKSVEVSFKDGVADLKLSRFGERTFQEWEEAVNQIVEKKAKGEVKSLVLDLRNNPGGFLQGAVFVASEFLPDGEVVKQENSRNGGTQTSSVDRKGRLTDIPLVVLINQGSASASEIVAGALQERGRAKLVGEKSFGKGTVQEAEDLPGGSGLHITIARWLLPSGKSIDKDGITPDVEVKMDESDQMKDPQFEKAIELLVK
ncbi:MAG: S41 family peptidase [bacterium]|nr:S41 family peptidase [bacterium]